MATLMTSGLVTPSSSRGRIIYRGEGRGAGERGESPPFYDLSWPLNYDRCQEVNFEMRILH